MGPGLGNGAKAPRTEGSPGQARTRKVASGRRGGLGLGLEGTVNRVPKEKEKKLSKWGQGLLPKEWTGLHAQNLLPRILFEQQ